MQEAPSLTVIDHPLIQHKLAHLRDRRTPKKLFKELVDEISTLMAYEVTRHIPLEDAEVETPLERTMARKVMGKKLVVVPILRAGLGMVEGIVRLIQVPGSDTSGYIVTKRRSYRWNTTSRSPRRRGERSSS